MNPLSRRSFAPGFWERALCHIVPNTPQKKFADRHDEHLKNNILSILFTVPWLWHIEFATKTSFLGGSGGGRYEYVHVSVDRKIAPRRKERKVLCSVSFMIMVLLLVVSRPLTVNLERN